MKVTLLNNPILDPVYKAIQVTRQVKDPIPVLPKVISKHHWNVLGHIQFSFLIEDISRACSHQLVRHWSNVFTMESQRYVDPVNRKDWYVLPPELPDSAEYTAHDDPHYPYNECMTFIWQCFEELAAEGVPNEVLRLLWPNAAKTTMVMSCRGRDLWHFFSMRICYRARNETRRLATEMLKLVKEACPQIFNHWEPRCDDCPEDCEQSVEFE